MLSKETIATIKQTAPILREHGEALTRHFYQRMFTHDPDVRAFFNPAHQHAGTQQRALAAAVAAYAEHIENPAVLSSAVELIAQKHASLGVKAEHYPIVGKHLLASIQEVLGAAATPEIIDAWAEAYGVLADIFIARESAIYDAHEQEHGWQGFRPMRVLRKQVESDVITSFYLARGDAEQGAPQPFTFLPGQYLTVRVPTPDGTTMRNYSISNRPGETHLRISVKREAAAAKDSPPGFVSHYLHQELSEGATLEVGPPCGEFVLEEHDRDHPLVLISAGVGVTPLLSMLHTAVRRPVQRPIYFIHAALHRRVHAFASEVRELAASCPHLQTHVRYSAPLAGDVAAAHCDSVGFIDQPLLADVLPGNDGSFYCCGPKPFMEAVLRTLTSWGVPASNQRYEFFGPLQEIHPAP